MADEKFSGIAALRAKPHFANLIPASGTHYIAPEKAARVIALMMEGTSLRAITRLMEIDLKTVLSLLETSPDITGPDWFGATSRVTGTIPSVRCGHPEPRYVSTSHVERLNLSLRLHLRRFVRRTNAHSRKLDNLKFAVHIFMAWFCLHRVHQTLRVTPAMEAGLTDHIWTMEELICHGSL